MNTTNYYTTIGAAFDYLVEIHQKTGAELTFPAALEGLRQRGALSRTPPPFPPYHYNMDREEFHTFVRGLPVQTGIVLEQLRSFSKDYIVYEPNMFAPGKDVFVFLNMPYLDREPHYHDFFEITYVLNGGCTFSFEGGIVSMSEGDVCITSPMAGHSQPLEPDCFALSIVVRKSTFNSLFPNLLSSQNLVSLFFRNSLYERPQANYILIRTGSDQALFQTAQQLTLETNISDDFSNTCSVSLLNLFLAQALRAGAEVSLHHYENYSEQNFDFTLILQYIQKNYRSVTLSALAKAFHFNEAYLSKLIYKNMGQSFTNLLRGLKMDRAWDYLMHTSMKVSEIAAAVGYDSVDHFSRTFNRMYGMPPRQYKQTHSSRLNAGPESEEHKTSSESAQPAQHE